MPWTSPLGRTRLPRLLALGRCGRGPRRNWRGSAAGKAQALYEQWRTEADQGIGALSREVAARKIQAQRLKRFLEHVPESDLPVGLIFSGEYMHPDKVPEPFREAQKLKMLELQLSMEIARAVLEHPDWEHVGEETIRQRESPQRAQEQFRQLLEQASRTVEKNDIITDLQKYAEGDANQVPETLSYIARRLLGRQPPKGRGDLGQLTKVTQFSPATLLLALKAGVAFEAAPSA